MKTWIFMILNIFLVFPLSASVDKPFQASSISQQSVQQSGIVLDSNVTPVSTHLADRHGHKNRPLSRIQLQSGIFFDFIDNEVLLKTNDKLALNAFIRRWHGTIINSYHGSDDVGTPQDVYVIKVDSSRVKTGQLTDQLDVLGIRIFEQVRVSSNRAKKLIYLMAQESAIYNLDIGFSMNMLFTNSSNEVSLLDLEKIFSLRE